MESVKQSGDWRPVSPDVDTSPRATNSQRMPYNVEATVRRELSWTDVRR